MLKMWSVKKANVGYKRRKLKKTVITSSTSNVVEMEIECSAGIFLFNTMKFIQLK